MVALLLNNRFIRSPQLLLAALCLLCLVPWVNKAFLIEDPVSLWIAKQIESDPTDLYGFEVNWYITNQPVVEITKNPPLASYYLALFGSLFGWSEAVVHLAFLLPALAVVLGTYRLAQAWCSRPALAALSTLVMPVFLLCSTSVMPDTLMLAFWIWALVLWDRGIRQEGWLCLGGAGVLLTLAALTKYFGIVLVPLLVIYSLAIRARPSRWLWPLLLPALGLAAYEWNIDAAYGRSVLAATTNEVLASPQFAQRGLWPSLFTGLAFMGGCVAAILFFAPLLWSRRVVLYGAAAVVVLTLVLPLLGDIGPHSLYSGSVRWAVALQWVVFGAGGLSLFLLAGSDLAKKRDPQGLLLLLWMLATFVFAVGMTGWISGASFLPLAPATGILVMRYLDRRLGPCRGQEGWRVYWPVLPTALLALLVVWADYRWAHSAREMAEDIHTQFADRKGTLWFQGHWGFQYYMQELGDKPFDFRSPECQVGDLVVLPGNNYNVAMDGRFARPMLMLSQPSCPWLATMNYRPGAGFYSDRWGPLPFAFGMAGREVYGVVMVIRTNQQARSRR